MDNDLISLKVSQQRECSINFQDLIFEQKEDDYFYQKNDTQSQKSLLTSSLQMNSTFKSLNILNDSQASNTNFLKNLGKLLRTWVKVKQMNKQSSPKALKFWQVFLKQKKINKNLFYLMYGKMNQSLQAMISLSKDYGIQQQYAPVSMVQLIQIQSSLREQTRRQLINADINFIVTNSRVQNKEQFQNYLKNFLKNLHIGIMSIKLNKVAQKKAE